MHVKTLYDESDFKDMGWHDNRLYAIIFPDENFQFKLNIDYIFKWVKEEGVYSKFWVSPAELIFNNVSNLTLSISFEDNLIITISEISRKNKISLSGAEDEIWTYKIETDLGTINFNSTGFRQKIISQPVLNDSQDLGRGP